VTADSGSQGDLAKALLATNSSLVELDATAWSNNTVRVLAATRVRRSIVDAQRDRRVGRAGERAGAAHRRRMNVLRVLLDAGPVDDRFGLGLVKSCLQSGAR
jgi:hypothetical protein